VCALTKSFDNHLLWAHYANGYSGVAIEVEIEDTDVTTVTYADDFIYLAQFMKSISPERRRRARHWRESTRTGAMKARFA
jgi:hypothetical protein